jgi:putative endopeptidase
LTIGENIADIGGCKIAYLALSHSLAGKRAMKLGGYTEQQRFFIAFAQMYKCKSRPSFSSYLLRVDTHSPDRFRVKGVLADTPEFSKAFPGPTASSGSATKIW